MKNKMLVYIAGKYTAPTKQEIKQNIVIVEELAKDVLLAGLIPIIPHKICSFFDLKFEELKHWKHEDWLNRFCLPLLSRCDAILLASNWTESQGARIEMEFAIENNIPVYFSIENIILRTATWLT
ncbi:MAG: DUF4406 domain-containing protein [Ignavibacteria bacterium]|nr:DUF4406 domain-containing protein [Ignavibacteria bacterium]